MIEDVIVSTKDRPGEYDAFETAKPGEPIFTLQGGDIHAPATIEFWADLHRTAGRKEPKAELRTKMLRKATRAEEQAWIFRDYYAGRSIEEVAQAKRFESEDITDANVIRARHVDRLNNAVAEIVAAADAMVELGLVAEAIRLRQSADIAREISGLIEPRRLKDVR